jgi:hypothetical protein
MTRGLCRYHHSGQSHFLTFSCYHRQPRFSTPAAYDLFLTCLEDMRCRVQGGYGYSPFPGGENEHFLFGGVGGDTGVTKVSVSGFVSHTSGDSVLHNSIGKIGDAGFSVFDGGVGVYVNTDSLTSCIDHG